jgi:hypothetical protein
MYCVSVNLTSGEWLTIAQAAAKEWPNETLSRAEIVRRLPVEENMTRFEILSGREWYLFGYVSVLT